MRQHLLDTYGVDSIYHFTDFSNIKDIVDTGAILSSSQLNLDEVISGGDPLSRRLDEEKGMDEYVHLCFIKEHPMEYIARVEDNRINTVWIKIDTEVLDKEGVLYTRNVANSNDPRIMNIEEAIQPARDGGFLLDYLYKPHLREMYFRTFINACKHEILVPEKVEFKYIKGFVYNGEETLI